MLLLGLFFIWVVLGLITILTSIVALLTMHAVLKSNNRMIKLLVHFISCQDDFEQNPDEVKASIFMED